MIRYSLSDLCHIKICILSKNKKCGFCLKKYGLCPIKCGLTQTSVRYAAI